MPMLSSVPTHANRAGWRHWVHGQTRKCRRLGNLITASIVRRTPERDSRFKTSTTRNDTIKPTSWSPYRQNIKSDGFISPSQLFFLRFNRRIRFPFFYSPNIPVENMRIKGGEGGTDSPSIPVCVRWLYLRQKSGAVRLPGGVGVTLRCADLLISWRNESDSRHNKQTNEKNGINDGNKEAAAMRSPTGSTSRRLNAAISSI